MYFEFITANRILFGAGRLSEVGTIASGFGKKAMVVSGASRERASRLFAILEKEEILPLHFSVAHEPTVELVARGVEIARLNNCDLVVSFGGGSAVDAAKAIAILSTNPGDIYDYLEVIGAGKPLTQTSMPFIAIPTTAGTGSEVTRNAVIGSPQHRVKVSLRSNLMLPRVALVDAELTRSMSPAVTAYTGMDALTQLIEPFVSNKANPLTDPLCVDGINRVAGSLYRAFSDGDDMEAREHMALASLYGGIALSNAGLGAVHGFAGPFGGMFEAPHGAVCARLLAPVMKVNIRASRHRQPDPKLMQRYEGISIMLTGRKEAKAEDSIDWIERLTESLQIPRLSSYGMDRDSIPDLIEKAKVASSMRANPIQLHDDELESILNEAL